MCLSSIPGASHLALRPRKRRPPKTALREVFFVACVPSSPRKHMLGADEPLQRSGTVTVGGQPHTVTDGRVKVLVGGKKELKRQGKHESLAELEQRLNRIVSMVSRSPSCCFAVAGRMPFRHRCMPALRRVAGRILRA